MATAPVQIFKHGDPEPELPTADDMLARADAELDAAFAALDEAYRRFGDAQDWLRSDWRPVGSPLLAGQVAKRAAMREVAAVGKQRINQIKNADGR